jgi:hypothetical protein
MGAAEREESRVRTFGNCENAPQRAAGVLELLLQALGVRPIACFLERCVEGAAGVTSISKGVDPSLPGYFAV